MSEVGITGFGVYLPRRRLCRRTAAAQQAWLAPSLKGQGRGVRTFAGWDEDTITMAVEAARIAAPATKRDQVQGVLFASTTPVFLDRLNAGIVAAALNLPETLSAADLTGSRRVGLTALLQAFDAAAAGRNTLVAVAEQRAARAASSQELAYGDAAASFVVGGGKPLARLVARHTLTVDFTDRYRAADAPYEYVWEERWAREEGFGKLAPQAIRAALVAADLSPEQVDRVVLPCPFAGLAPRVAEAAGLAAGRVTADVGDSLGDLGASASLVQLAAALETARPGERILVADFGQGCEVIVLETTDAILETRPSSSFSNQFEAGVLEENYLRFLTIRGLIDWEKGPKAEKDTRGSMTVLYRNRRMLLGFVGARHRQTGDVQFPPSRMALEEPGAELDLLEPWPLADRLGSVVSWSADRTALTPDPPNYYGMVAFDGGGRLMMDFTDVLGGPVQTGQAMRMVFRVKETDHPRHFTRYFWKATPL